MTEKQKQQLIDKRDKQSLGRQAALKKLSDLELAKLTDYTLFNL